MKRLALVCLLALPLAACGGGGGATTPSTPGSVSPGQPVPGSGTRVYSASASVGDFLTLTVDPNAKTIAYTNKSNGDSGAATYTVNADGSYALTDPSGNLQTAIEIPGFGMIVQAAKTGPNHNTAALVTAITQTPITLASWGGHAYNFIQFRTGAGGMEVGSVAPDAAGNISLSGYWPFSLTTNNGTGFVNNLVAASRVSADPAGTYLQISDAGGSSDYVFGTANGLFAVDTNSGALIGLQKAVSKAFDPSVAGTYQGLAYQKSGASYSGSTENGTVAIGRTSFTIDSSGNVTVTNAQQQTVLTGKLTPVADAAYLQGAGQLSDPCNGLFTFRVSTATTQQDVFAAFQGRAAFFASFTGPLPAHTGGIYTYQYGVALH